MVSVRSIAISFRQSRCQCSSTRAKFCHLERSACTHATCSRPYPTTASAYVELQQQLLQRFGDDIKTSGLSLDEQHEWLREVCEAAAVEWVTCVDDILTTARCAAPPRACFALYRCADGVCALLQAAGRLCSEVAGACRWGCNGTSCRGWGL